MELQVREGFKRVPKKDSDEQEEEEECHNGCSKHANEGVCVVLLFVIKDTYCTWISTEF